MILLGLYKFNSYTEKDTFVRHRSFTSIILSVSICDTIIVRAHGNCDEISFDSDAVVFTVLKGYLLLLLFFIIRASSIQ